VSPLRPALIDVHSHVVPRSLPRDPTGGEIGAWPSVHCEACGRLAQVKVGGKPFRDIDERSWDVDRRVADMDQDGVAAQALSPMPELLSYWLDMRGALEMTRHLNHTIGEMVARRPDRFFGLGRATSRPRLWNMIGLPSMPRFCRRTSRHVSWSSGG